MDIDLDSGSNEGNSPEPIFHSIINAMGSKKEATADQIYRRIQRDGASNYSKPQVDRALANALQYGIFEVRNNRYRVRDDVLDDEDTIYWQAHIKREKTPYRLENSQRDYINPEKDQHTFRRLHVSDGEGCMSCRKQTAAVEVTRGKKGRVDNQKVANINIKNNRCVKDNGDHVQKATTTRARKVAAMKRQTMQATNRKTSVKRAARNAGRRDAKRRKRDLSCVMPEHEHNPHSHYTQESDSDVSSKAVRRKKRKTTRKDDYDEDDEEDEDDDEEEEDDEDEEDEDEDEDEDDRDEDDEEDGAAEVNDTLPHSSYFEYMKEPYASQFSSTPGKRSNYPCNEDIDRPANESDGTGLPGEKNCENRNWNLGCRQSDNLQVGAWCNKVDWLVNRPQNTEDGTVKQFDNALKIEPLDSLPFKNMEEPSYIS